VLELGPPTARQASWNKYFEGSCDRYKKKKGEDGFEIKEDLKVGARFAYPG